ncbi:MAG: DNA repair protein RecN [Coriobacteriia bacterium]|nr:DNA repair protein RecN [Coriobacteriia bacterium]
MLEELHVADLALIEDVWLELGPGLTVLTGETGAGKTVLVGALKLLLGERADPTMVRAGAEEAVVEGRFSLDGAERTARRRISAEGRSRCYLDGEMSTVAGLSEAFGDAVDLHGQHDHQALLSPSSHAAYLDRFIGAPASTALQEYRDALRAADGAASERDALAAAMHDRDRRVDQLAYQVAEIDAVGPTAGEDDAIDARLPVLRHGERLAGAASVAFGHLKGDGGASDALSEALAALQPVEGLDPEMDALAARLGEAAMSLEDAGADLRRYGEGVEYDPAALDSAETRLAALTGLKRKYGPTLTDVIEAREAAVSALETLESGEEGLRRAEERVAAAEDALVAAATGLAVVRSDAASGFTTALADAARDLAMLSAAFDVAFTPLSRALWSPDGHQRVEFLFSSNAGEPLRPLVRIASGGEVSRVMLALKSVLGAADVVPVLVFDEVDAGIGGATALAVGRRLAALAQRHQVLVVTHLPQVAAFADHHLVVSKAERDGRTFTLVQEASGDERVAEVARMLSGSDTEAGLAHARELLTEVGARTV